MRKIFQARLRPIKKRSQDESYYCLKTGDVYFYEKIILLLQNYNAATSLNPQNTILPIKIVRTLGTSQNNTSKSAGRKITPDTQASLYYKGLLSASLMKKIAKDFLQKSISKGTDEN